MQIRVDHSAGLTYLHVGRPGREVSYTRYLTGLNVDYDGEGAIVGIEVFAVPGVHVIDLTEGSAGSS